MSWMNKREYEAHAGNDWGFLPVAVTNSGTIKKLKGIYGEEANVNSASTFVLVEKNNKAQLAATDTIQVVSSSASDITQSVFIEGVDSSGAYISETIALNAANGTTAVDSASALWRAVHNVYLSATCAGNITIRRKTGATGIWVVSIGDLTPLSATYVVPMNKRFGFLSDYWATSSEEGQVGVFISSAQVLNDTAITWLPIWEFASGASGEKFGDSKHFYMPVKIPTGYAVAVMATGTATGDVKAQLFGWNE